MSRKALYLQEPEISTYTSYGCLFSIMSEPLWPWVFNHFIQIRYAKGWKMFAFDNHHMLLKNCPGLSFYQLPQDMVVAKWGKSLKEVIIESIDLGYYLYIFVDRHHISLADSYQNGHNIHDLLIYGYDSDKEMALVADNFEERFIKAECPFSELEEGYWCLPDKYDFWTEIRFLKRHTAVECSINMEQIAAGMENYLYSKPTFDMVEEQQFDFGFQALQRLLPDLQEINSSSSAQFDLRAFHLLYEHKILMEKRLAYLMEYGYMQHDQHLLDTSAVLKHHYLSLRNLVIKYRFKEDEKLLLSIFDKLRENMEQEQLFILSCLEKMKT
ncbi:hypothetical protein SAMN04487969_101788 [Paenibacillus algorifonticola]|uniref:Butirosin biosynthesis protein H, N-terminal n=1 Tax=Paenibacillus algorifonticola TaxID=684063 RepID=A0A1I1YTX5_9BACL|nr:hypothetical protein [Paenibacillus algorifonticola]SFE23054.1 hypothetical protein SAMN04487969_101788 [Paenibacillus algorifonticola]